VLTGAKERAEKLKEEMEDIRKNTAAIATESHKITWAAWTAEAAEPWQKQWRQAAVESAKRLTEMDVLAGGRAARMGLADVEDIYSGSQRILAADRAAALTTKRQAEAVAREKAEQDEEAGWRYAEEGELIKERSRLAETEAGLLRSREARGNWQAAVKKFTETPGYGGPPPEEAELRLLYDRYLQRKEAWAAKGGKPAGRILPYAEFVEEVTEGQRRAISAGAMGTWSAMGGRALDPGQAAAQQAERETAKNTGVMADDVRQIRRLMGQNGTAFS
jgi:hypothetical protein